MDDNTYDVLDNDSDEHRYFACENKCYENDRCTAFSFETPRDSFYLSCYTYTGGPYTKGSGRRNTKCYKRPGEFVSFFKYAIP